MDVILLQIDPLTHLDIVYKFKLIARAQDIELPFCQQHEHSNEAFYCYIWWNWI